MTAQSVVQLFFNPTSGSFSSRRLKALAGALQAEGAQVITTPSVDREPIFAEQATHICIAGGDGTIRHVAANLARSGRVLPTAIYPAGTVNLLAREGSFRRSPAACARELLRGNGGGRPHHPVSLGETMFFACASAGPDSAAVAGLSPGLKRVIGRAAYVVAFLKVLWRWPRPRLRLSFEGRSLDCEAVYIAKGRYFAGRGASHPAPACRNGQCMSSPCPRRGGGTTWVSSGRCCWGAIPARAGGPFASLAPT